MGISQTCNPEPDRSLNQIHQEDNLFTSRVNLMLLSESMLLISYITSLNIGLERNWIGLIMSLLGFAISIIFFTILVKQVEFIKQLRLNLEKIYPKYKDLRDKKPITYANDYIGFILPLVFSIVWIVFIAYSFSSLIGYIF